MIAKGVFVRDRTKDPATPNCFRLTTGVVEHTRKAVETLEALCAELLIDRRTAETQIKVTLALDGKGRYENRTGIRFLDHMLDLVARHGGFDLKVKATGDLDVDQHHTVEDVGIALGEAVAGGDRQQARHQSRRLLRDADGRNAGGRRDRSRAAGRTRWSTPRSRCALVGDLQTELVHDFFDGFAMAARANVHLKVMYGRSNHHKIEACFKAFARALRVAVLERQAPGADAAEHQGPAVIALVDYGAGNLTSVRKALAAIGANVVDADGRRRARPRPRHHRARRRPLRLDARALTDDWRAAIKTTVDDGVPLLGICVGLQWLFEGSDEAPDVEGLGVFKGTCLHFCGTRPASESGP